MVKKCLSFCRHRKLWTFKTTNGNSTDLQLLSIKQRDLELSKFLATEIIKKLIFSNERNVNWILNIGLVWFSRNYREYSQINKIITINSSSQLLVMQFKLGSIISDVGINFLEDESQIIFFFVHLLLKTAKILIFSCRILNFRICKTSLTYTPQNQTLGHLAFDSTLY